MKSVRANDVRQFLLTRYATQIRAVGLNPTDVPDEFDFLLSGIVDSFGILEMVTAVENAFQLQLDLASLDAENISILGPLSEYVATTAISLDRSDPAEQRCPVQSA